MCLRTLFFLCCTLLTSESRLTTPCKENDETCLTKFSNEMYKAIMPGIASLNIEKLDPIFYDSLEGNLITLKYDLINTTIKGFKLCNVVRTKLSLEREKLSFEIDCPVLTGYGDYKIEGQLLTIPIEGNGEYRIDCKDYLIAVSTDIKVKQKSDGRNYMSLKTFTVDADLRGGMKVNLTNLFNGNEELSDFTLKFMNNNWKPVSRFLQGPVINANIMKLVRNFNRYIRVQPLDTLIEA